MNNRITDTEYAHYCACYTAIKTGAPAFVGGTVRESTLSALATDDAKGVLGVLPCMSSETGPLVDLRKIDLNGAQVMTLYYPRGYNVQELLDGVREMAQRATIQDIDSVSARLHAALNPSKSTSKDSDKSKDSDNLKSIADSIENIALKAVARSFRRATEER